MNEFIKKLSFSGNNKVLYLPLNSIEMYQNATEQAFVDNNYHVISYDFRNMSDKFSKDKANDQFKKIAYEFNPDWIHMQLQFSNIIYPETLKLIKKKCDTYITNWTGDVRNIPNSYFCQCSKHIDLSLISSIGQIIDYKKIGTKNIKYWQIGYDPNSFHPLPDKVKEKIKKWDISFCANLNLKYPGAKTRYNIAKTLSKKYKSKFKLYGNGWNRNIKPVNYWHQQMVYNSSKIAISTNNFNNIEMYFSDRQLITMATGTLVICHYIPGLEKYFENHKHCVWFHNLDECLELVDYYLKHEDERKKIAKNGAEIVKNEHTYYHRVKELSLLKKE